MPVHSDFFPPSDRVIYSQPPLRQVIAQLRFPTILKIDGEVPHEFQERIRGNFPHVERETGIPNLPAEIAPFLTQQSCYVFKDDDASELRLASNSLSLTMGLYKRWEGFRALFNPAIDALTGIYKPSFFSRTGLRYINIIDKNHLGLSNTPWTSLISEKLISTLTVPGLEEFTVEFQNAVRVRAENTLGSSLFLQHGFFAENNALSYKIDFDFYKDEKVMCDDAKSALDTLNQRVGRAFRWCISEQLHTAMGPVSLERNVN